MIISERILPFADMWYVDHPGPLAMHAELQGRGTPVVAVGVKTGRSRVGGPELCVMDRWVIGDRGHDVYLGSSPLNGGNTILPA